MKFWHERPKEEAHLLNPAFCCVSISAFVRGYTSVKSEGVPFPLIFMALPIVLHKPTRELLPPSTRTSMAAWLLGNPSARVLFYERVLSLKPYTKEALLFGLLHNWIVTQSGGLFQTTKTEADINRAIRKLTNESRECVMRARFLGKWFASAGAAQTVMSFWGVRP